jgi:hypothetical protein
MYSEVSLTQEENYCDVFPEISSLHILLTEKAQDSHTK